MSSKSMVPPGNASTSGAPSGASIAPLTPDLSVAERLRDAAASSALMAEAAGAIKAHFHPQYVACWEVGRMVHQDRALKLYPYVIEKGREEESWRHDAALLTEGAEVIDRLCAALKQAVAWMVDIAESGDAGFWDPETTPQVIAARAAIAKATGGEAS